MRTNRSSHRLLVDARHATHLSPPSTTAPYAVLRSRFSVDFATNVSGQRTVLLFSEHLSNLVANNELRVCPIVGYRGVGTNVPLSPDEVALSDPRVAQLPTGCRGRLHAITLTISPTGSATTSTGVFYAGVMPGNINRGSFGTFNAIADAVITRPSLRQYTAFTALQKPVVIASAPQDVMTWSANEIIDPIAGTHGLASSDSLLPIVLIFAPTAAAVDYTITVNTEWRIVYPMSDDRSTLHKLQPAATTTEVKAATAKQTEGSGEITFPDGASILDQMLGASPAPTGPTGFLPSRAPRPYRPKFSSQR